MINKIVINKKTKHFKVKRLSNRVKEAAFSIDKNIELLNINGESTKTEISEYFKRYINELKHREEYFLNEVDCFIQTENRIMTTLSDVLVVENENLQDACVWVDLILDDQQQASDEELSRIKNSFVEGLDYLRNFQV